MRKRLVFGLAFLCISSLPLAALAAAPAQQAALPPPTQKDVHYGPHERNVLDLWQAESATPTPLVIFIHGGGFLAGDKSGVSPQLLSGCLKAGISVAAINYRYSSQAPFPAPFLDCGRAVQFLRLKSSEWKLDPKRFGATGGSAGAGMSLWLGFHDDLADAKSDDPVLRQSSRLSCMAVMGAQSSYDPRFIKEHIGGRAHEHSALPRLYGLKPDELDTPKAYKMYEEASAINFLTADDPPVYLFYSEPKGPLPANAAPGQGIHHPNFGVVLKEKMDALKIECILRHSDDLAGKPGANAQQEAVEFFKKHL
jgi:acetyl esterase